MPQQLTPRRSLRFKFLLVSGILLVVVAGALIALSTINARTMEVEAARNNARNTAELFAEELHGRLNSALQSSKVLAQGFSALAVGDSTGLNRDEAHDLLINVLEDNPSFFGVYTAWEPNAFDGNDSAFVSTLGHDTTGRFLPYWSRNSDGVPFLEPTLGYEGEWYQEVKATGDLLVMDPVNYTVDSQKVFLVTVEAPIFRQGQFVGLVGIDISLSALQSEVETRALAAEVELSVVANNGTVVAHSAKADWAGQQVDTLVANGEVWTASVQAGLSKENWTDDQFTLSVPLTVVGNDRPWQVGLAVPKERMLAAANAQMRNNLLLGVGMLVLALVLIRFVVQRMARPIVQMAEATRAMAQGDLEEKTIANTSDEIGLMKAAFQDLREGLLRTSAFANKIGEGDLDADFEVLSEKDQLGQALLTMREQLKVSAEQDKIQNWTNHGLARFGEILRNYNDNLSELGQEIISNLVSYLDACQAKFYVMREGEGEEGEYLDLVATYAFDRQKFLEEKVLIGEGMAGQVVMDRGPIFLTDVPEEYMTISSGLGDAKPGSILVMPLAINEEINGVMEIASFNVLQEHQIDFVQRLGESIAASISSVKVAEQTQRLLTNTHQQAEELRAQEEEMRQNLEELQATQEEMQRAQVALRQQEMNLNALIDHTTDSILLLDPQYNILVLNKVLKDRYKGTNYENIGPGMNVLDLFSNSDLRLEWKGYYDQGLRGEKLEFTLESTVNKEENTYRSYYIYPIRQDGEVAGISVISRDVTTEKRALLLNDKLKARLESLGEIA